MSNPKTTQSSPSKPRSYNGWVRKFELDEYLDRFLPVPTQVVSNEEYFPIPQTRRQQAVEHKALELADRNAKKLGLSRRQFLRTSCGMAVSFAAMNSVFGELFTVDAAELLEPAAAAEKKTKFFIFDVQTHHVGTGAQVPSASKELIDFVLGLRKSLGANDPALAVGREVKIEDLQLETFIKEIYLDSETDVIALSALPTATEAGAVLPPHVIAHSKKVVNELANSQRMVSHGLFSPDLGARNMEWMAEQAENLKIDAWKGYTGQPMVEGTPGWWLDDEKRTYPALEYSRKMKIKNICLHKGLPLFFHDAQYYSPADVVKASKDFPDLNFLLYHSGFKSLQEAKPAVDSGLKVSYVPWVSDLCEWRRKNLHMGNVYMELGSTFALMTVTSPLLCAHVLGMIIRAFGADNVLWGTDSIFWGSPQWQIEAFRRLQMPEDLMKRFGYAPLTDDVKAKIFGRNAARIYGVDIGKQRKAIPSDYLERLQKIYQQGTLPSPSNTQYGWVHA